MCKIIFLMLSYKRNFRYRIPYIKACNIFCDTNIMKYSLYLHENED